MLIYEYSYICTGKQGHTNKKKCCFHFTES